jgi:hypothetical protein
MNLDEIRARRRARRTRFGGSPTPLSTSLFLIVGAMILVAGFWLLSRRACIPHRSTPPRAAVSRTSALCDTEAEAGRSVAPAGEHEP